MPTERIFMSKPDVGELEERYVLAAMRSGWIAPLGPDVDAFEHEMKTRIGVDHAVALASGTAALHLGLLALGIEPGDIVVTSTMTFAATANAITYTDAIPYFVDADTTTGNMDPELLRHTLHTLTAQGTAAKAIVPVDLFGKTADYTAIQAIAEEYGIPVFADAAESLGAAHRGKPAGSFGKAAILSFNGNKIMTTSGGGMLLTNDAALADKVRYLATQARQPAVHYEHTDIGYNYRMSNLLAALGRAQLRRLDEMIARRKMWRNRYRTFFSTVQGIEIFGGPDDEDNYWLTSIMIDPKQAGIDAATLQTGLEQANIESRPLWKPMHLQPVFTTYPAHTSGAAQHQFENGLTLPSGSGMTEHQFTRVLSTVHNILETTRS